MFLVNQRTIRRFILIYTSLIPYTFLYGNSPSPPLGKTGAPGNGSCAECHTNKGAANPGHVILDVGRLAYLPGVKQTVRIHILPQRDMPLTGFQLTARLESGTRMQAGHFESSSNTTVQLVDGIEYVSNSVSEPEPTP